MPWKVDALLVLFRLLLFFFTFTLIVLFIYFLGTIQSFKDQSLFWLFQTAEVLSFLGGLVSLFYGSVFLRTRQKKSYRLAIAGFFLAFFLIIFLVLQFIHVWIYR